MTSVQTVQYMLKKNQKVYLVDVRGREEFNKVNIPGSINIPLHAVKTKTFLKSGPIVLIGKGFEYSRMEMEIQKLSKRGFKARVLNGGIYAWYHSKSPVAGDLIELNTYNKITPLDFYTSKDFDNQLIVDVSKKQSKDLKMVFPYAVHVPASRGMDSVVSVLSSDRINQSKIRVSKESKTQIERYKKDNHRTAVIVNEDGEGYERVEKTLLKAGISNVYYLNGGAKGYKQFLHNLALSQRPRSDRIKTVGDCNKCSKKMEE